MKPDDHPETLKIDLPWLATARAKKLEAYRQYEAYNQQWESYKSGKTKVPPSVLLFRENPWFKVLVAENAIERAKSKLPGVPARFGWPEIPMGGRKHKVSAAVLEAAVALHRAEEALYDSHRRSRNGSERAATTLYELGSAVRNLERFTAPRHIEKINARRREGGGELRRAVRGVIESSVGTLSPVDVLEELTKRKGWTILNDAVCVTRFDLKRNRLVSARRIVSWGRFQNVVSEENHRFTKSLHGTACAVKS